MYFSINIVFGSMVFSGNLSVMASLAIRMATYGVFCGYLMWIRFAMRYNNVKAFVKILITSQIAQIVS